MARTIRTTTQRGIAVVSSLTIAGLALAGCAGGSDDSGAESGDTLKLWHYEGADSAMGKAWAEAIKIFEEETGATVEFEEKSFEQIQTTASQVLDTDAAPDLMEFNKGNATAGFLASTGPDHRHLRRRRRVRLGRQARPVAADDRQVQRRRRHGRRHLVRHPELRRVRRRLLQRGRVRRSRPRDPDHVRRVRRRAGRVRRAGHHARSPRPARSTRSGQLWYQLALSEADRQFVNDYQLYENPVDWQGDEITYATETLQEYVDKGYIASDVSSVKAEDAGVVVHQRHRADLRLGLVVVRPLRERGDRLRLDAFRPSPSRDLSLGSSGNLWVVPENAANKELAYEFIDITMRPEIQAIIGNNGGVPVAADPADITDEKSAELIATFNGILDADGLSFYPDWPAPGFYDVIVQELQGLVTGVQDVETTNANLGEQYDEGTAEFR